MEEVGVLTKGTNHDANNLLMDTLQQSEKLADLFSLEKKIGNCTLLRQQS